LLTQTTYEKATLLFLHHEGEKDIPIRELCKWVEHPNVTNFRIQILKKLHAEKRVFLNEKARVCRILPPGIRYVEENILPKTQP
jgi:hypothetical protein